MALGLCIFAALGRSVAAADRVTCEDRRPAPADRKFVSPAVDAFIAKVQRELNNSVLACVFGNTLPNTLDTTVDERGSAAGSFIITGDIDAMWLRDSTNQVAPYYRFAGADPGLRAMLKGLVRTQTQQVLADPYANAHSDPAKAGPSPNAKDATTAPGFGPSRVASMVPGIYERKYELDSLCAFLKTSRLYYGATGDRTPLDATWERATGVAVAVMEAMTESTAADAARPGGPAYLFQRSAVEPTDTLLHSVGTPARANGMIRSAFRPSDDATTYQFLVPSNAMAVVELRAVAPLLASRALRNRTLALAASVEAAIERRAPRNGVLAYEVDGFDNYNFMDDANIPSLLSLPYLGYNSDAYAKTRAFVLSAANPWFFSGAAGEGVGGPHVGSGKIWPMAIIARALTSEDDEEIAACLETLVASTAGTGLMHESFDANDAADFTRPWFAWANSLFGELVIRLRAERPALLARAY